MSKKDGQPISGGPYIVQQGDTLSSIAQQAYGDQSLWQEIYNANTQVIGGNPNHITPGTQLFIPQHRQAQPTPQTCKVTVDILDIRANSSAESAWIASFPAGTILNFYEIVEGEAVDGNPHWGHSVQNHFYWMGGTDRPHG